MKTKRHWKEEDDAAVEETVQNLAALHGPDWNLDNIEKALDAMMEEEDEENASVKKFDEPGAPFTCPPRLFRNEYITTCNPKVITLSRFLSKNLILCTK